MASDVDIANLALTKLGAQPIVSFEDNNPRSAAFLRSYDLLRDKLQRTHRWSFTRKFIADLPALLTPPPATQQQYGHAYSLPTDFLALDLFGAYMPGVNLNDWNNTRNQDYVIVGRQIYSYYPPPAQIMYFSRVTDPKQFDAAFVDALACYLAWQLCELLTSSNEKKSAAFQEYKDSLGEAVRANAVELPPETIADDTWMWSRLAGN
jgi:hypothetical protein